MIQLRRRDAPQTVQQRLGEGGIRLRFGKAALGQLIDLKSALQAEVEVIGELPLPEFQRNLWYGISRLGSRRNQYKKQHRDKPGRHFSRSGSLLVPSHTGVSRANGIGGGL